MARRIRDAKAPSSGCRRHDREDKDDDEPTSHAGRKAAQLEYTNGQHVEQLSAQLLHAVVILAATALSARGPAASRQSRTRFAELCSAIVGAVHSTAGFPTNDYALAGAVASKYSCSPEFSGRDHHRIWTRPGSI